MTTPTRVRPMRTSVLFTVLCGLGPALLGAQDTAIVIIPESAGVSVQPRELPRIVAEEAIRLYNASTTTRLVGRTRLPPGNEWRGDVAVRNGSIAVGGRGAGNGLRVKRGAGLAPPGQIAVGGRIAGTVLVINGDAAIDSTAEITGDLIVIGGTVTVARASAVRGEVRQYREPLAYRTQGDEIALAPNLRRRFPSLGAQKSWGTAESRSALTIATSGTFNRVEGLPIVFGPTFDWKVADGLRIRFDALGIFRTAGNLSDRGSDLGYLVRSELRAGDRQALGLELRAYSMVAPVEDWGLHNAEVGWSAFLFQRDYRDYYTNKGVAGRAFVQPEPSLNFALELRREVERGLGL